MVLVRWILVVLLLLVTIALALLNPFVALAAATGASIAFVVVVWWTRGTWQPNYSLVRARLMALRARRASVRRLMAIGLAVVLVPIVLLASLSLTAFVVGPFPDTWTLPYSMELRLEGEPEHWVVTERYTLVSKLRATKDIQSDIGDIPAGWVLERRVNDAPVIALRREIPIDGISPFAASAWSTFQPTTLGGTEVAYVPADATVTVESPHLSLIETEPASTPAAKSRGTEDVRTFTFPGSDVDPGHVVVNVRSLRPELRNDVVYRMATFSVSTIAAALILGLWSILVGLLKKHVGEAIGSFLGRLVGSTKEVKPPAVAP